MKTFILYENTLTEAEYIANVGFSFVSLYSYECRDLPANVHDRHETSRYNKYLLVDDTVYLGISMMDDVLFITNGGNIGSLDIDIKSLPQGMSLINADLDNEEAIDFSEYIADINLFDNCQ